MAQARYLVMDGKVVPYEQGCVHVMTPAFRYGAVVFEGIRFYWSERRRNTFVFRLREHVERMMESMKLMRFDHAPTVEALMAATVEIIRANELREQGHIRMFAFVDGDGEQSATGPIRWSITALPMARRARVKEGVKVGISSWQRINDNAMPPRAKVAANYNNGRMAGIQGKLDGYDNVLMLTQFGHVAESPGSCFFMVRRGQPITPAVTDSILESITRATVMQILDETFGMKTAERNIDRTEVYLADEAFFCGSGQEIVPILSVDHHRLGTGGIGPLTAKLQERYFALVTGGTNDHEDWLTPVFAG